jgi:hypothetical protein
MVPSISGIGVGVLVGLGVEDGDFVGVAEDGALEGETWGCFVGIDVLVGSAEIAKVLVAASKEISDVEHADIPGNR